MKKDFFAMSFFAQFDRFCKILQNGVRGPKRRKVVKKIIISFEHKPERNYEPDKAAAKSLVYNTL